jgi:hypothetical protein
MADYSAFDKGIIPWLQKVWTDRAAIEQGVRTIGRDEGAWLVYDRYNDPKEDKKETEAWTLFRQDAKRLSKEYGITCGPQKGDPWRPNDFYHFGANPRPGKGLWRIYAHVKEPRPYNWTPTAVYCLHMMKTMNLEVIEKFKVAGPGFSKDRGDQIVIWVNNEDAKNSTLASLAQSCAGNYDGQVPAGVKQVQAGLGWSKEPTAADHGSPAVDELYGTDLHSFGSFLAGVIYLALEQSFRGSEENYVNELTEFFLNVGIDPANPHVLRTISWEELKHMAGVGNGNVVRSGLVKPTTVFTDQTKPFPV